MYLTSLRCHPRQCGRSHPIEDRDWDGIVLLSIPCRILCACILELLCVIYTVHNFYAEFQWLTVIRNKFTVILRRRRLFDIRRHFLAIRGIFWSCLFRHAQMMQEKSYLGDAFAQPGVMATKAYEVDIVLSSSPNQPLCVWTCEVGNDYER